MICLPVLLLLCQLATIKAEHVTPLALKQSATVAPPKLPVVHRGVISTAPHRKDGFVYAKGGHLYLGNELFDFRGFNGPTLLDGTIFENTDLIKSIAGFGTPVTRIYTLKVANDMFGRVTSAADAHITGWDKSTQDWTYNEEKWQQMDRALAIAAEHGVKIIMPLINQDYGDDSTDFVGNFIDLIRHRFNISDYTTAQVAVDWFVEPRIRLDFKKILKKFLTRVNTVNGRVYGNDDTFLAFETGNEMNWANITLNNSTNSTTAGNSTTKSAAAASSTTNSTAPANITLTHTRPAPYEWTVDIAQYLKSLAPKTLVMDGSYARNPDPKSAWPEETLKSPYVDIFSYHLYGDGDILIYDALNERVKEFGKVFVIGEHGFYNAEASFAKAYKTINCAGALLWSLRPHAETNGFIVHSESASVFSYHVSGWPNSTAKNFDPREAGIVRLTYQASFDVLQQPVAKFPIPDAPFPYFATNGTHTGISWKGAAWADHYEVWGAEAQGQEFVKVAGPVFDNVDAGDLFIPIDPTTPTSTLKIPFKPIIPVTPQVWTDHKWATHPHTTKSMSEMRSIPLLKRDYIQRASRLVRRGAASHISRRSTTGGWYAVRGFSADGISGDFSEPTYIPSNA